jgi:hypothetical protein
MAADRFLLKDWNTYFIGNYLLTDAKKKATMEGRFLNLQRSLFSQGSQPLPVP